MQQQHPSPPATAATPAAPSCPRRSRRIRPLPKEVVDRIAAGEVVQRPVSVVKELVENSLDAGATRIDVQCARGGLDSISVTDDGRGISPRDLPLACTRFATSKLVEVDDLKSIRTFGFRGEALASASMVGRVAITSRVRPRVKVKSVAANGTNDNGDNDDGEGSSDDGMSSLSNCAFKMHYRDGAPDPSTNPRSRPKPSAGREGTVVQVQDLFHNIPSRRRAMEGRRAERDEYDRVLDVVRRYAVHEAKRGVGFLCRDSGGGGGGGVKKKGARGRFGNSGNRTDLNTQSLASVKRVQERRKRARSSSAATQQQGNLEEEEELAATKDVVGHVFGAAVTRELLPLKSSEGDVEAVSVAALKAMVQNKGDGSSGDDGTNESGKREAGKDVGESNRSDKFTASLLEEMMVGVTDEGPAKKLADPANANEATNATSIQPSKFSFAYRATGLITNGSYSAPKNSAAFLLFVNGRLVESVSIRRAVEFVYADTLPRGSRPFVYLSLEIPGPHVDVNVHPTKREVAFLHEDRLCDAVGRAVRGAIGSATTSRTFSVATSGRLLPQNEEGGGGRMGNNIKQKLKRVAVLEGLSPKESVSELTSGAGKENMVNLHVDAGKGGIEKSSSPIAGDAIKKVVDAAEGSNLELQKSGGKTPKKRAKDNENKSTPSFNKKPYDPSGYVRTSRALPVGAMEPFLVRKKAKVSFGEKAREKADNTSKQTNATAPIVLKHKPGCPLANNPSGAQIDMTVPGAFALAICRCQIKRAESLPPAPTNGFSVQTNNSNVMRPKRIVKTDCHYESIGNLRDEIDDQNHQSMNEMLRNSVYVGAVTRSRSLIQCGVDLVMVNHRELARKMFYQVALWKFSGMPMAELGGGGVDVLAVIGQMLQFEEDLSSSSSNMICEDTGLGAVKKMNNTNANMARQATACLASKAPMLEEYFSIKLEQVKVYSVRQKQKQTTSLRITGLPILLEGHSPQPHGLPLFLLRLATEVNWTEEEACFRGVCTELASYYSDLPFVPKVNAGEEGRDNLDLIDDEAKKYVKYTLFPAISFLLVPPKDFAEDGAFVKLANLKSLYKVFERC